MPTDVGVGCPNDTLTANRADWMAAQASSNWPLNRLLLALPSRNLRQLRPELEQIRCQRAQVLMNADSPLDHVFFPDSGVVSVVAVYADGSVIEMATIGREGFTDVQAVFGAKRSSVQLLVQIPGSAALLPGKVGSAEGLGWGWITGGDCGKVPTYQRWDAASQICAAVFRRAFG